MTAKCQQWSAVTARLHIPQHNVVALRPVPANAPLATVKDVKAVNSAGHFRRYVAQTDARRCVPHADTAVDRAGQEVRRCGIEPGDVLHVVLVTSELLIEGLGVGDLTFELIDHPM